MTHRLALPVVSLLLFAPVALPAQTRGPETGTLVIAYPRDPASPVPTLWRGDVGNREVSDLLFLHLLDLGPQLLAGDERKFVPKLARFTRIDSLTIVFDIDPRAKWQDGNPVVAADVVFTLERARNPKYGAAAAMLSRIDRVTSDNPRQVTVRFKVPYSEQLYDVVYHAPPLPSHLLGSINPDSLGASSFISNPVGNGPYRLVRREPGRLSELASNPDFFLGSPKVTRILIQAVSNPDARANMLRAGEIDALDNIYSLPDPVAVKALADYRYYPTLGPNIQYLIFNFRNPADTSKPHPLLSDAVIRHALVLAIDRERLAQSNLGPFTHAPSAPISGLMARTADPPAQIPYNLAEAKRLLASRGWRDTNGDGILDKNGAPLTVSLMVPATSASRRLMAAQIQEAYRAAGIELKLEVLDVPTPYVTRRERGEFDMEFYGVTQDPTPSGLVTSWNCASSPTSNTGHYCNPVVDSLVRRGTLSRGPAPAVWREVAKRIADDYPAIFIAAPVYYTPVHKRFEKVTIRPESMWSEVWKWNVKPGAQIDRDRQ